MTYAEVCLLSLIQGLTEFLPISSSAHLILVPKLFGMPDQGLSFDVAVHLGTLLAVCVYYRQSLLSMASALTQPIATQKQSPDARLAWAVLIGTIPVGLAGLLFHHMVETQLRATEIIATTTIIFGLLLLYADKCHQENRKLTEITIGIVLFIGVAQALALVPGTSRSGITLTAGLLCGLSRQDAARYSFLLSIPVICLAGLLEVLQIAQGAGIASLGQLSVALVVSFASALCCIYFFLQLLNRIGLTPFVIYRLLLGVILGLYFI